MTRDIEPATDIADKLRDAAHCNDWFLRQEAATVIDRLRDAIPLLQRLAWFYDVNDCRYRRRDDALEVPISDLRAARKIVKALGLEPRP